MQENQIEKWEEVRHQINTEIAGIAGILNGATVNDSGQAHIAQMKLGKILEALELVETLITQTRKEDYNEGYKQGVWDEVQCIETSGEHGEAVKKIRKETIESVLPEILNYNKDLSEVEYNCVIEGRNTCRSQIIQKAKNKWNINL